MTSEYALLTETDLVLRLDEYEKRPSNPVGKNWRWVPVNRQPLLLYQNLDSRLENGVLMIEGSDIDLAEAKDVARSLATNRFREAVNSGVVIDGNRIATTTQKIVELEEAAVEAAALQDGETFDAITADGAELRLTRSIADALVVATKLYRRQCQRREFALYQAIKAAVDVPALRAIDINAEWPA